MAKVPGEFPGFGETHVEPKTPVRAGVLTLKKKPKSLSKSCPDGKHCSKR